MIAQISAAQCGHRIEKRGDGGESAARLKTGKSPSRRFKKFPRCGYPGPVDVGNQRIPSCSSRTRCHSSCRMPGRGASTVCCQSQAVLSPTCSMQSVRGLISSSVVSVSDTAWAVSWTQCGPVLNRDSAERGKAQKNLVGAIGFEPMTPCAQGRCATRLRYAPTTTARLILKDFPILFHSRLWFPGSDCARTVHECGYCTVPVPIGAAPKGSVAANAISLARRLSFSRASRFICNFIWEYFLKTCASP
jgi:hypothetical protein